VAGDLTSRKERTQPSLDWRQFSGGHTGEAKQRSRQVVHNAASRAQTSCAGGRDCSSGTWAGNGFGMPCSMARRRSPKVGRRRLHLGRHRRPARLTLGFGGVTHCIRCLVKPPLRREIRLAESAKAAARCSPRGIRARSVGKAGRNTCQPPTAEQRRSAIDLKVTTSRSGCADCPLRQDSRSWGRDR